MLVFSKTFFVFFLRLSSLVVFETFVFCFLFQALGPHLKTGNLGNVLCGSSYKVPSLADLTKLAQKVIVTEQLEDHIRATVDTATANYAIVGILRRQQHLQSSK